jgi:hypothetical protein
LSILLVWYYRNGFNNVFQANKETIGMILPFFLILIILYKTYINKYLKVDQFLTIFSLLLAILFFSFSFTYDKLREQKESENKLNTIKATTEINCAKANDLKNKFKDNNELFHLDSFTTQIYEENFNIFYTLYGKEGGTKIVSAVSAMKSVNSLIGIVIKLDSELALAPTAQAVMLIPASIKLRNNDIATKSQDIINSLCWLIK